MYTLGPMGNRIVAATCKFSQDDIKKINKAKEKRWPGAPISRSTLIRTLLMEKVDEILSEHDDARTPAQKK